MANLTLSSKVPQALEQIGKKLGKQDLLDRRAVTAALLDEVPGDTPGVDLVLLAHKHGVARAVADVRGKKLSQKEVARLTKFAEQKLFGIEEESAYYVVDAWGKAFGKVVPQRTKPQKANPKAKMPRTQRQLRLQRSW